MQDTFTSWYNKAMELLVMGGDGGDSSGTPASDAMQMLPPVR